MKGLGRNTRFKKTQKRTGGSIGGTRPKLGTYTAKVPPKKKRGYGKASEGKTGKAGGGQTKFQKAYSKLTPKQKQSDAMKMYLANRPRKKPSGRPSLARNTGEPTNVRKKRPGGFATGGQAVKQQQKQQLQNRALGKAIKSGVGRLLTPSVPLPKPKKKRGYGKAAEGRTGKQAGGGTPKKGYKGKSTAERIAWQEQQPALRTGGSKGPPVTGRPHKVAGFGNINPNEPTNVRRSPWGGSKGGKTGYRGRGATEIGKEQKVQSYKEYVKKAFGGGSIK